MGEGLRSEGVLKSKLSDSAFFFNLVAFPFCENKAHFFLFFFIMFISDLCFGKVGSKQSKTGGCLLNSEQCKQTHPMCE